MTLTEEQIKQLNNTQDFISAVQLFKGGHNTPKYLKILTEMFPTMTMNLKYFTLRKKLMGTENISWIATQSSEYQEKFCSWYANKNWKAEKNELDLWFSQNPGV